MIPPSAQSSSLNRAEQQRQVAVDAFFLQHRRSLNALPGRCDLDQHALFADARGRVQPNQLARLGDGARGVEREACVDLGGDPAWHDVEDFETKADQYLINDGIDALAL